MKYIISPKVEYSGNLVTSNRIASYFSDCLVTTTIENISKDDIIIGVHAYKVGKELINKNLNFVIIVAGTDLNCDFYDVNKKKIILEVFSQANKIIVFNTYQKNVLLYNNFESVVIPQSISSDLPTNNFNVKKKLNICNNSKIFLIIGNLRRVKDPFFLINEFKKLYNEFGYQFIYIGSNLDSYDMSYKWIHHIDGLDQISTYSAITQADGLINSSLSEGMSSTILEAMVLKCPVYARINNSNEYIINHNITGYLFNKPSDFLEKIKQSYNKDKIINNAFNYVSKYMNTNIEKEAYNRLMKN